jgi:hypothetical protein
MAMEMDAHLSKFFDPHEGITIKFIRVIIYDANVNLHQMTKLNFRKPQRK